MDKSGVLDPERMLPSLPARGDDELSILAEMAVKAAEDAIRAWGKPVSEIGAVICAASNMQRPYPAMAIEVQQALGIEGFAFDMNVACSSATFGIKTAADFVASGSVKAVLMVNPEICSAHLNFKDRDSHFIFGDVATAVIIEAEDQAGPGGWDILGTKLQTSFSNNIRNNFGFLNRAALPTDGHEPVSSDGLTDKMFVQQGRKVFKEVVPMVSDDDPGPRRRAGPGHARAEAPVAAPGQHQHEHPDRQEGAGSRARAERERHHPGRLRQHLFGRVDHRLPPAQRRLRAGRDGPDLQLRRRLFCGHGFCAKAPLIVPDQESIFPAPLALFGNFCKP
jgi:hypothetical protein